MSSLAENMTRYTRQVQEGAVPRAYRGLMDYMRRLRTHFQNAHPHVFVPGSLYAGTMDMTFFPLSMSSLRDRKLKLILVFVHEACRFDVWLCGLNKQSQAKYWKLFKERGWHKYRVVPSLEGRDSIVECVAAEKPDFSDLDSLTRDLDRTVCAFAADIEAFLKKP